MSMDRRLAAGVLALALVTCAGCGGGGGTPSGDAGPDAGGCAPGTQDQNGDGVCNPDCSATACENGTCSVDGTSGLAACACDPGYAGDACDMLAAPDTAGLLFWLDADDPTSYVADVGTGALTSWDDKVGGLTSTIAAPGNAPLVVSDTLNGRPVVRFDGIDDEISWAGFTGLDSTDPSGEAEYTIFLVVETAIGSINGTLLEGLGATNQLLLHTTIQGLEFVHDPGTASTLTYSASNYVSSGWSSGAPHQVTLRKKNGEMSMWVDGSYRFTVPTADTNALDEALTLALGNGMTVNSMLDGDVAELIVAAGALDYEARIAVEDYLGVKWFGAAFTRNPTTFGLTTIWLDASQGTTITEAAGTVSAWANLGVDGGFFAPGGPNTTHPTRVSGALGGLDVIRFDGGDALVENGIDTYDGASSNAYTFVAILVPPGTGGTNTLFHTISGLNPGLRLDLLPSVPGLQYLHRWPSGATGGDAFAPTFTLDGARRILVSRSGPSYHFEVDDATSNLSGSADPALNIAGGFSLNWILGGDDVSPTTGLTGDIAEVVFMHAVLTSEEELALRNMLEAKWGL